MHSGYKSPSYVSSLSEFGAPRKLPYSGGWILERSVGGTGDRDAMGPYPLFACVDWTALGRDLLVADNDLVSLTLVADPLADPGEEVLQESFPDLLVPFKQHWVLDPATASERHLPTHHRRHLRRSRASIDVDVPNNPSTALADVISLYAALVRRHHLVGIRELSPTALQRQLAVPGCIVVRGRYDGQVAGVTVWYRDGTRAYYHLGAYSMVGYRVSASYALVWCAIQILAEGGVRLLELGGGAGHEDSPEDGLNRFKRGWASTYRTAHLCGRICNRDAYERLTRASGAGRATWFPAYRAAEADLAGARTEGTPGSRQSSARHVSHLTSGS
jgi:hypothetical protein